MVSKMCLILCCCVSMSLVGQITSSDMAGVGSVYSHKKVINYLGEDFENLEMALFNSNSTDNVWDFSGLETDEEDYFVESIINPFDAPHFGAMTDANYCSMQTSISNGTEKYRFYNLSDSFYSLVGIWNESFSIENIYDNPKVEIAFPVVPGATNVDMWTIESPYVLGGFNLECIGTGTLILPDGIEYSGITLLKGHYSSEPVYYDVYQFLGPDGFARMTYQTPYSTVVGGASAKWSYVYEETVAVNEFLVDELDVWSNNLVSDKIYLDFNLDRSRALVLTLFGHTGSLILEERIILSSGFQSHIIDAHEFSNGLYFLNVQDENSITLKTLKLVVQ